MNGPRVWRARRVWSLWRRRLLLCLATWRRRLLPQAAWPPWRLACQLSNSASDVEPSLRAEQARIRSSVLRFLSRRLHNCVLLRNSSTIVFGALVTDECCHTLTGHTTAVLECAFSPIFDNLVLSCSCDKRLKLWDETTGACTATLEGHQDDINCCAFSTDGATIASGDTSGELKLWRRA